MKQFKNVNGSVIIGWRKKTVKKQSQKWEKLKRRGRNTHRNRDKAEAGR